MKTFKQHIAEATDPKKIIASYLKKVKTGLDGKYGTDIASLAVHMRDENIKFKTADDLIKQLNDNKDWSVHDGVIQLGKFFSAYLPKDVEDAIGSIK